MPHFSELQHPLSPMNPSLLRALTLSGSHERGFINRLKGILSPVPRTVAVISFEMKLKVSLCYMSWVQHYFNTNTTVRAFFRLRKKPSFLLTAPFSAKFFAELFYKKARRRRHASFSTNQNLKSILQLLLTFLTFLLIFVTKYYIIEKDARILSKNTREKCL